MMRSLAATLAAAARRTLESPSARRSSSTALGVLRFLAVSKPESTVGGVCLGV